MTRFNGYYWGIGGYSKVFCGYLRVSGGIGGYWNYRLTNTYPFLTCSICTCASQLRLQHILSACQTAKISMGIRVAVNELDLIPLPRKISSFPPLAD
jgi:hypothetical protein